MTNTAERLLADIQELAPDITLRAAEIEGARRIPLDLVEMLRSIGIFRMFVPQSHGGLELDLPSALEIIGALGRIDGSVGWTAAIANGADLFAPLLPRATYDQVYEHGPDVIIAGTAQPAGTAETDAGGWRVNGRWPFASGCQHADWMFGLCIVTEGGTPVPGEAGAPLVRGFFLPAHNWQIEDTWYVAGLKGTGSHHIALKDTVVPAANFFDLCELRAVPAWAALPGRPASPSAHTRRHLGGSRSGRLGGPCGDGRYRPAAVGGRQADAGVGNVPRRAGSYRSRTERGASLARGPGHEPLAARACRNAEGRGAPHPGHPDRDMARHDLRSRRRRVFRARRWQRAL